MRNGLQRKIECEYLGVWFGPFVGPMKDAVKTKWSG
jgi:hypothetical protein